MPDTKKNKSKRITKSYETTATNESRIRWGESYTSLILGIIVVIVGFVLIFTFIQHRNFNKTKDTSSTATNEQNKIMPQIYTVKTGEDLWTISEKIYGSGYNWVDLANENKLSDPGIIYAGTKLVIPNVKKKIVQIANADSQDNKSGSDNSTSITGSTYVIQSGDFLWDIAVKAYGDGYKWTEIAKANNLSNPDLIFSGNVLNIPR